MRTFTWSVFSTSTSAWSKWPHRGLTSRSSPWAHRWSIGPSRNSAWSFALESGVQRVTLRNCLRLYPIVARIFHRGNSFPIKDKSQFHYIAIARKPSFWLGSLTSGSIPLTFGQRRGKTGMLPCSAHSATTEIMQWRGAFSSSRIRYKSAGVASLSKQNSTFYIVLMKLLRSEL